VAIGIGASAIVHVALLAWVAFPGTAPADEASKLRRSSPTDALQLISVRLPDVATPAPDSEEDGSTAGASGGAASDEPETERPEPAPSSAIAAEAAVTTTRMTSLATVDRVQPVSLLRSASLETEITALGDITAIEPADAPALTGHEGHLHTLAEEGPGFWDRLAEGFSLGVSGGGHCPMDADLIGAARDRGFAIPQARGGGLTLPRAGGFTIPQSRGLGVRLPGGIGR
jgi:hypothetical protein